jgi:beta-lactamase class A
MVRTILIFGAIVFCFGVWLAVSDWQLKRNVSLRTPVWHLAKNSPEEKRSNNKLRQVVEKSLEGTTGTYAVIVKNFKSLEEVRLNEDRIFLSGSLYKLWVVAVVYQMAFDGKIDLSESLNESVPALNAYFGLAGDDAELTFGVINYPISEALKQMITISHNYAALSLVKRIGAETIKDFLISNKFSGSVIKSPPQTTARDIAGLLEKLHANEYFGSKEMTSLLLGQKLNEGLPKYLPKEAKIAHKTGEVYQFKHGAGVVFGPKGDYLIVVLSESDSPFGAEERIALLSRDVYNYFNQ